MKLLNQMICSDMASVDAAYAVRRQIEHGRSRQTELADAGYELLDDVSGEVTEDGREIVFVDGAAYALRPEVHIVQLEAEFELERRRRPSLVIGEATPSEHDAREALAATTCPQITGGKVCGGSLQQSGICPRCDLGKQGYIYRYTCESCGYDVALKGPLS